MRKRSYLLFFLAITLLGWVAWTRQDGKNIKQMEIRKPVEGPLEVLTNVHFVLKIENNQ